MNKNVVVGIIAGAAGLVVGATSAVLVKNAVDKIKQEIKDDLRDYTFTSPNGDNTVTLSYGSSKTLRGLTYIKVFAASEANSDHCTMIAISRKVEELFEGEWIDNDQFKLAIGGGNSKQYCDVNFEGEKIVATYYLRKISL